MNCREKILSEDYMSILLDYVPEEADQEDEAFCYQQVDGTLGIYYLDRSAVLPLSPVNYLYRYLPQLFCLGAFPAAGSRTFRTEPLEGSGILAQQRPPLELTGRRVVMAFIDTGISYENPVFRYSDGSSRILAIWDQTDQSGQSPEGFFFFFFTVTNALLRKLPRQTREEAAAPTGTPHQELLKRLELLK